MLQKLEIVKGILSRFIGPDVFLTLMGASYADVGSELAQRDLDNLIGGAKRLVRDVSEQIQTPEIFERLLDQHVNVELIVGPTQDRRIIQQLKAKGATVYEHKNPIVQPFTIVDGEHIRITEEPVPGRKNSRQYITRKDLIGAERYSHDFDSLVASIK